MLIGLIVYYLLNWFSNSLKAEVVTTNNLLNQTFTTSNNWQGQLSSNHGTGIIAGENGGYVETINDISLKNDAGLTEAQIQNGWISNQSAQAWFWNDNTQNLTMKQIVTSSSGSTVTQTKIVTGSCATYNGCAFQATGNNTFISTLNTNTDYSIKNRFEFNSTGNYTTSHNAADLKLPSLTITYENTPISVNDQKDIIENARIIVEEIQETKVPIIKETVVEIKEEPKPQPVIAIVEEKPEPKPEVKEETKVIPKKEEKETTTIIKNEEKKEPDSKDVAASPVPTKESKEPKAVQSKEVKTGTVKVDSQIKDIGRDMKLNNLVVIKAMTDNTMISVYNVPFYKSKKMYENQLSIADNRLLYANNLNRYIVNDPLVKYNRALINIKSEKQRLLNEIRMLKNG
jgi:hypothetical protein